LIKKAEKAFNFFIRERDREGDYFKCPTCRRTKKIENGNYHACHFFPAGQYAWHRFNEDNVFGGCLQCNYFKHGAGYNYSDYVRKRIGEEKYNRLIELNQHYKRVGFKWDRYELILLIEKYK
jgi:hypothetical protein